MDQMMKDDPSQHKLIQDVQTQISDAGFTAQEQSPKLKAIGTGYSILV